MKINGIKHIRSAPYHPATNGEAERFVQTFKHAMKAAKNDEGTLETKIARFLLMYRNIPSVSTGQSPAELLFHRPLCTRMTLLSPNTSIVVANKQAQQKCYHDKKSTRQERQFEIGESVLVENSKPDPKWLPGTVLERLGPLSYRVQVGNVEWKRHIDQILASASHVEPNNDDSAFDSILTETESVHPECENVTTEMAVSTPRYPQRERHPPERFNPSEY